MGNHNWIIDAHQDIAFASLFYHRDYRLPIAEIRAKEPNNTENQATLSWDAYQKGDIRIIFSTIFVGSQDNSAAPAEISAPSSAYDQFNLSVQQQMNFYNRYQTESPEKYQLITSRDQLNGFLEEKKAGEAPGKVGLVIMIEGCERLRQFDDLTAYYEAGIRIIGPVWEGGRWCGGTCSDSSQGITQEGRLLLQRMAEAGYILDVSHMNSRSARDGIAAYPGLVIASHANCRALLTNPPNERHLDDDTINRLIERDSVIGVIPYNEFLDCSWHSGDPREKEPLTKLADHIDHICQLAGNAAHAALGSDLDGGFGFPNIPLEMNDIGDLPLLEQILQHRGYHQDEIAAIFHGNWLRMLMKGLP